MATTKKPKQKRTSHAYKPITQAEADKMFDVYYALGRNLTATAREFDKDRSSIRRYCKRYDWINKADKIKASQEKAMEKQAGEQVESDIKMITDVQLKVVSKIKGYLDDSKSKFSISISDLATLTRLKLEIQGNLPSGGDSNTHGDVITIIQNLSETDKEQCDQSVAAVLQQLGRSKNPRLRQTL